MQTEKRSAKTRYQLEKEKRTPNLRLKELRLNAGLSQRQLARLAGIKSASCVALAEKGWVPHPHNRFALATALRVASTDIWPIDQAAE